MSDISQTPGPVLTAPRSPAQRLVSSITGSPTAAIFIALLVSCVVMSILSDRFFTASNITNILSQSAVVGIAAVGGTLVIITGGIDLSVGSIIGLAGLLSAVFVQNGLPGPLAIIAALIIGASIGAFNGFSITVLRLVPFILTLATLGMARGLTLQISQGTSVYGLPADFTFLGSTIGGVPIPVVLTILTFAIGHLVLTRTTLGHQIFAVGGNREAARLAGIRVSAVTFWVYVIAGFCAGLAALVLVGRLGSATPGGGTGIELQVIAAIVIGGTSLFGGKGSMIGTLVGVLLIGVINNGLNLIGMDTYIQSIVKGLIILVAVAIVSRTTKLKLL